MVDDCLNSKHDTWDYYYAKNIGIDHYDGAEQSRPTFTKTINNGFACFPPSEKKPCPSNP
jgi:hypothetical protein